MRCSPVLLAALTASAATLGWTSTAQANPQSQPAPANSEAARAGANPSRREDVNSLQLIRSQSRLETIASITAPEASGVEFVAQTPAQLPDPADQIPGTDDAVPVPVEPAPPVEVTPPERPPRRQQRPAPPEGEDAAPSQPVPPEPETPPTQLEAPQSPAPPAPQPGPGLPTISPQQPSSPGQQPPAPEQQQVPGQPAPSPGQPPAPGQQPPTVPGQPQQPPAPPGTQAPAAPGAPAPGATEAEPRVLVGEVRVVGAEGDLQTEVYNAIRTQAGRTTTRSQLQEDINAIFATGFFSNVRAVPEDTPLGVRITFEVQPNPTLRAVRLEGNLVERLTYEGEEVPIQEAVDAIFGNQYGQIINLRQFQTGIEALNKLYQDNGYVLAQVVDAPQVAPDGTVTLDVAEGQIEDIQIRFLDRDGQATDEEGNPIEGRTREFIITREFESQPGDVFNRNQIQADLQRAFGLGIFEDLSLQLNPGQDPRRVDVIVNVTERQTGSIGASFGLSSSTGLFGGVSFQEQNLGGNNQRLNADIQVGERDILFDVNFTDPWIAGDPNRTSYTVGAFGRQSISLIYDGGENEITLPNGDRPRIRRLGGGVTFSRPLGENWRGSLGLQYQHIIVTDADGDRSPRDEFGVPLAFNESGVDDLTTLQLSLSNDRRNSPGQPTSGSILRFSTEQTIPVGGILFNRVRANYSFFLPVRLARFTEGCQQEGFNATDCPQTLAFNVQAGTIVGDLPPYEAFALGGDESVRGYGPGDLGSGRSFLQGTVEYRFPVFSIVSGVLFVDAATDLGTASDIPGDPANRRDKPGSGFGYGVGLRVNAGALGNIRVDYGFSDQGDSRFSFGIGERF